MTLALDLQTTNGTNYTIGYTLAAAGPLENLNTPPPFSGSFMIGSQQYLHFLSANYTIYPLARFFSDPIDLSWLMVFSTICNSIQASDILNRVRIHGNLTAGCASISIAGVLNQPPITLATNGSNSICFITLPSQSSPTAYNFELQIDIPPALPGFIRIVTGVPCNLFNQSYLDFSIPSLLARVT